MLTHPGSSIHSFCLHSQTSLSTSLCLRYSYIKNWKERNLAGSVLTQHGGMMNLLTTGFMAQCVWTHTCWEAVPLDELHTHLQHTRKFSTGSGCVSRPRGHSEDPDSISYMPSIPSSWVGERTLRLDNEPVTSNTQKTQLCI